MARKYENDFYSVQFIGAEPIQIGAVLMNEEDVKKDLERFEQEMKEYDSMTQDLNSVIEVLVKEFHKQGLNGRMAPESFIAREIAAYNRKLRTEAKEGETPVLLSQKVSLPEPAMEIEYLKFPAGKVKTITDVKEFILEAQLEGATLEHLGKLNKPDVEAYGSDPLFFVFTSLDAGELNEADQAPLIEAPTHVGDENEGKGILPDVKGEPEVDPASVEIPTEETPMPEPQTGGEIPTKPEEEAPGEQPAEEGGSDHDSDHGSDHEEAKATNTAEIARALEESKDTNAAATE